MCVLGPGECGDSAHVCQGASVPAGRQRISCFPEGPAEDLFPAPAEASSRVGAPAPASWDLGSPDPPSGTSGSQDLSCQPHRPLPTLQGPRLLPQPLSSCVCTQPTLGLASQCESLASLPCPLRVWTACLSHTGALGSLLLSAHLSHEPLTAGLQIQIPLQLHGEPQPLESFPARTPGLCPVPARRRGGCCPH